MRDYIKNNRWIVSALVASNFFWFLVYYSATAPGTLSLIFLGIAKFLVMGLMVGGFVIAMKLALDIFMDD